MNGRKLKTGQGTCQRIDRPEAELYFGGQTFLWMNEKGHTNIMGAKPGLLEYILSPSNLSKAYKQVKGNDWGSGIYNMDIKRLLPPVFFINNQMFSLFCYREEESSDPLVILQFKNKY
jgi:hypothetical protein